jgi:hypothetical protein
MNEIPVNFEQFSDKDLYAYCKKVGFNARKWHRRFIAVIPEVAKRRLYKKYGYCSINEFASKLAGVSHDNVDEVLRVNEKFKELPKMKALIGEVGLSKLRVVACVANKENENDIAGKVKNMTKSSLEIYVREKFGRSENSISNRLKFLPGEANGLVAKVENAQAQEQIELFENNLESEPVVANPQNHDKKAFTIQIDGETEFELRKFKQKFEKERKEPVDWNLALKEMVRRATSIHDKLRKNIKQNEKTIQPDDSIVDVRSKAIKSATTSEPRSKFMNVKPASEKPISRYIPAKIKCELRQKHNDHCAYWGCNKPAEQIHHQNRFALKRNHKDLIPLCKIHHDFIHQIELDKIFNVYKMEYGT